MNKKSTSYSDFLSNESIKKIENTIAKSEKNTSAEIRLFVEKKCSFIDSLDRCKEVFKELEMQNTIDRNGVLLYIAYKDHQTAIYGDININKYAGHNFWDKTITNMIDLFKEKKYEKGICDCILEIGKKLKEYFPYKTGDVDELSNEVVFGNNSKKK